MSPDHHVTNKMATSTEGQLTNSQIAALAHVISGTNLECIALGYLGISPVTIKNFKDARRNDIKAFSRDIIQHWINKNPHPDQAKVIVFVFPSSYVNIISHKSKAMLPTF